MSRAEALRTVDTTVGARIRLADFRPTVTPLTPPERDLLIDQAMLMLEQTFVHLPLKRAIHGTEPIQRLRLLRLRHAALDERAFQSAMIDVFTDLRDLHTNYVLPGGYRTKFAFLPFRIEEYYEDEGKARKYVVTWISPVNTDPNLVLGAEATHWNGSPIELAVARNADREAGSNSEARRARGIEGLTLRWFGMTLPPDEDWVVLTYRVGNATYDVKFHWEVIDASDRPALLAGLLDRAESPEDAAVWGIDLKTDLLHRARTALFDPQAVDVHEKMTARRAALSSGEIDEAAATTATALADEPGLAAVSLFPDVFPRFGPVDTPSGQFGYIRLRTFAPTLNPTSGTSSLEEVIAEFARILGLLPPTGLILDVRDNGGGIVLFGERLLQMLTPGPIVPEPFHFIATALTHRIAASNVFVRQWQEPIAQAIETGASFSQGFPLTPPELCNNVGQVYQGPVVLITNALCYSTTDIFSAGFRDHKIGTILGVHNNTGAGGANVWDHALLQRLSLPPANPFVALPQGAGMRAAIRRSTRVGDQSGVPLEDLGVVPDVLYRMTRRDVLEHNVDLIAAAAKILAAQPTQVLRLTPVAPEGSAPVQHLTFQASNIDRIDTLVNGRPLISQDVPGPGANSVTGSITLPAHVPAGSMIMANGYREGRLVVSTRLRA